MGTSLFRFYQGYREFVQALIADGRTRTNGGGRLFCYTVLTLVGNAVDLLRTRHKNGEMYYWLLYYTYLSPQRLQNVDEIMEQLRPHMRDISVPTYYRKRKQAVEALSSILWGFTSQDSLKILDEFFPE